MSDLTYKALLVGNSTFPEDPHNLPTLKGPPNDLELLENALSHPQVGLHAPENVTTILDRTRNEIMEKIEEFFSTAKRDDQLFFYYSGHGRLDKFSNLYLCARDTRTNILVSSAVSDEAINSMIRNSVSSRVVIVLDCCHSGRFKGADLPRNLLGEGRFVLTSSRARELSLDSSEEDGPSAFTKHLVNALLSGEVDTNQDEYVSINEIYDYILPKLMDETKQVPQRNFGTSFGELAIGRSVPKKREPGVKIESDKRGRPVLNVSETNIKITEVFPNEKLPDEIIDVFNEGSGNLDWTVDCEDDWITIEKFKGYFKLKLNPKPGVNRGRVYVRDRGVGGSKRIQVYVQVLDEEVKPKLVLSDDRIDFGNVFRNTSVPARSIRLENTGGGELETAVKTSADWLSARLLGDVLDITIDTSKTGDFNGTIYLRSNGGDAQIPVKVFVEEGPVLEVNPVQLDFGTVSEDDLDEHRKIKIRNSGSGELDWQFETNDAFLQVEKTSKGLKVWMDANPGSYHGTIFIKSNGGNKTIDVRAKIEASYMDQGPTATPQFMNIAGQWGLQGVGSFIFMGQGPNYNYTEYNTFGIMCGQGSAFVQGNVVTLQGQNIVSGAVTAQLTVMGNQMNGYMNVFGQSMPLTMFRM